MALFDWFGSPRNSNYEKGINAYDDGSYEEAIGHFERCLESSDDPATLRLARFYVSECYSQLGITAMRCGSFDQTVVWLKKALEQHPNYPDLHYNLAFAHRKLGRAEDALAAAGNAIVLNSRFAKAILLQGLLWFEAGQEAEGIERMKFAAALEDGLNNDTFKWGIQLLESGDKEMGCGVLQTVRNSSEEDAQVHIRLGNDSFQRGRHHEAIAEYRKALGIRPNYSDIRCKLGQSLLAVGKTYEASDELTQALKINPEFADAKFHLARVMIAAGDVGRAALTLDELISTHTDYPGAVEIRNSLAA